MAHRAIVSVADIDKLHKRCRCKNGTFSYNKKYMITYKIIYDITQDAYNWFNSINNFGGMKKLSDPKEFEIATQIEGLNFSKAKKS